jgi:hypothetical protein
MLRRGRGAVKQMGRSAVCATQRESQQNGSIRRECLDHVIILDEEGLRRVLASYIRYYHRSRLHLSLDKDSPDSRPAQSVGKIVAIPEVGGLHHRYERPAAQKTLRSGFDSERAVQVYAHRTGWCDITCAGNR